jgi:serine/threonine-protein kinase
MVERSNTAVARASAAPDPLVGRVIQDRYTLTAVVARGGMGKVYKAEQRPLNRVCAVKVLNPNYAGDQDPEFEKRFFLEASIAAKLTHPNSVTVFDYGRTEGDDGFYFMAMEYLEGQTLQRGIREAGFFTEERTCHVARQICRALREAHGLGVIHRDLKPANVFLVQHGDESDFVKVLDFGLVKNVSDSKTEDLTQTGLFMGSPKYMAPEQIQGQRVDARTDIYALGVILYEMLVGKVPFDRPNSVHILMAHVNEPPPDMRVVNPHLAISAELEALVASCLAKNPDQRPDSMDAVLTALKRTAGGTLTGTMSSYAGTGELRPLTASDANAALGTITGVGRLARSGSVQPPAFADPAAAPTAFANVAGEKSAVAKALPAALGGVAVAALIGFLVWRSTAKPADAPAPAAPSSAAAPLAPPAAPVVAAVPAAAAAPVVVPFEFKSNPMGAAVIDATNTVVCGATPCSYTPKGVAPGASVTLRFRRDGFKDKPVTFVVNEAASEVVLERMAVPTAIPAARPKAPDNAGGQSKDFKDDPY